MCAKRKRWIAVVLTGESGGRHGVLWLHLDVLAHGGGGDGHSKRGVQMLAMLRLCCESERVLAMLEWEAAMRPTRVESENYVEDDDGVETG